MPDGTGAAGTAKQTWEKAKIPKKPKCFVSFRPRKGYEGEYGFDWIRFKDDKISTVNGTRGNEDDTKDILGLYSRHGCTKTNCSYKVQCQASPKNVCIDINSWSTQFEKDVNQVQYKNLYSKFSLKQINGWDDVIYSDTPKMTLLPSNNKVKLSLIVYIKDAPIDDLFWDYDETVFDLTPPNVDKNKEGEQTVEFELKCNKTFLLNKKVKVFCDKEKKKLCGELEILANDEKTYQRKIDVVLIKIKCDIAPPNTDSGFTKFIKEVISFFTGSSSPTTHTGNFNGGVEGITKVLKQAYVTIDDSKPPIILPIKQFDDRFIVEEAGKRKIKFDGALLPYLNNMVNKLDSKYTTYFKVYAMGEECGGGTLGFSRPGTDSCIVFTGHNTSTVPHELLHSLTLPHTFTAKDTSANALYTYEAKITDNVMDYSHWNNLQRISTFHWQWKLINNKIIIS